MARAKIREVETHHNQKMTDGAAAHVQNQESRPDGTKQKVVVLRLTDAEYQAFKAQGGAKAFKAWLADNNQADDSQ